MKFNRRVIQLKVIEQMSKLCSDRFDNSIPIQTAAKIVSKESNDPIITASRGQDLIIICSRTCVRWYNLWLDFGMLPCDIKYKYLRKQNSNWNDPNSTVVLKSIVDNCPILYLDEISKELYIRLNIKFSGHQISTRLRKTLGYSRKIVYEKASQQVRKDKNNFIAAMEFYISDPELPIWIDESNKDRKAARRKWGWSKVGLPVYYRAPFNTDIKYTLIGAADCYGFVTEACDTDDSVSSSSFSHSSFLWISRGMKSSTWQQMSKIIATIF